VTPCEFRPLDALGKPEEHSLTQPWPWIRLPCFPLPAAGAARTHQWPSLTDCLAGTKKAPALNARASQPFPEGSSGEWPGQSIRAVEAANSTNVQSTNGQAAARK
jgi:hypothetical protein